MDWQTPIAAGVSGGAGLIGSAIAAKRMKKEARRNRDFQERMSNTQYQRGVKDLEKAGLSKLLAYGNLQTSSPQGSVAQVPDFGKTATDSVATALAVKRQGKELALLDEQAEKLRLENMLARPGATVAQELFDAAQTALKSGNISGFIKKLIGPPGEPTTATKLRNDVNKPLPVPSGKSTPGKGLIKKPRSGASGSW